MRDAARKPWEAAVAVARAISRGQYYGPLVLLRVPDLVGQGQAGQLGLGEGAGGSDAEVLQRHGQLPDVLGPAGP